MRGGTPGLSTTVYFTAPVYLVPVARFPVARTPAACFPGARTPLVTSFTHAPGVSPVVVMVVLVPTMCPFVTILMFGPGIVPSNKGPGNNTPVPLTFCSVAGPGHDAPVPLTFYSFSLVTACLKLHRSPSLAIHQHRVSRNLSLARRCLAALAAGVNTLFTGSDCGCCSTFTRLRKLSTRLNSQALSHCFVRSSNGGTTGTSNFHQAFRLRRIHKWLRHVVLCTTT